MRVFVTGAAGFIGSAVARRLVARGDRVVAVVHDPSRATALRELGVDLRQGDLARTPAIVDAMRGSDAAIHLAGRYRIGIRVSERPAMLDANVGVVHRVLDAVATAGVERIVHASTINVFGNTRGKIVDERYRRDLGDGFLSYYDETKFLAHRAAEERIAAGSPVVIVIPGMAYGAGDHSSIGAELKAAHDGTARYVALGDAGISTVFVDDLAAGIVGALDRGRIGEAYVLAGENVRVRDAMAVAARVGGQRLPRLEIPVAFLRFGSQAPASLARMAGLPDDLREVLKSALGVTYWASSAKAAAELGYTPRDLASGIRAAFGDG
ncbi:MAG: NAD-dependent epimerase/dehydratase family protein [Candidatus Limnocylindrales bacterium]